MSDILFESELNELLDKCRSIINTESYVVDEYTQERENELRLAKEKNIDLQPYLKDEYNGFQLHEIRLGIEHHVDVKMYDDINYSWKQMYEIRHGMESGVNIVCYADALFSDRQMREIRLGLEYGIDVSSYAKLMFSTTDMHNIRAKLFAQKYIKNCYCYSKTITCEDSGIVIRMGANLMEAYAKIPSGKSFSIETIIEALDENDITYGYIDENIRALAEKGADAGELVIANGVPFELGYDGSYRMLWRKYEPPTPKERVDGTVDFSSVDLVENVKAGQAIAIYKPSHKGKNGVTVTGIDISNTAGNELPQLHGRDIFLGSDGVTYYSRQDGYVIFNERDYSIEIQNVFVVNGDANYLTGNIIYDGSVRVKGNVEDDVIIDAKGDVIVEGYVQGAYVSSGNNVVVVGGVNAGDKGYIAAQKTVYGDYFENANVYAYENVEANYIMNSQINAGVLVKAKGMICGGNVISGFKIIARSFGNKAHTRTILCAAAGRKFEQRLDDENIMRVHVEKDIETLTLGQQKLIQTIPADKLANNDIYIKVGIALRMKNETLSSIMGEIKVLQNRISDIKNASISALDTVYPNTTIIINSIARNIVDEIDNVTFYQRDQSVLTKKFSR